MILTGEELYTITGRYQIVRSEKATAVSAQRAKTVFQKTGAAVYTLSDLKELDLEDFISSARLTGTYHGEYQTICYCSNRVKNDIRLFLKYMQMYLNEKKITADEDDFKKDSFCPKCGNRYPDENRKVCPKCMDKAGLLKKLLPYIKKYKFQSMAVIFTIVLLSILSLLTPYLSSSFFYDQVLDLSLIHI